MTPLFLRLRRWLWCVVIVLAFALLWFAPRFWAGPRPDGVPYGIKFIPGTTWFGTQDLACHLNYLNRIAAKETPHPYRLEDQETMMRAWYPAGSSGQAHAYSPVVLILGWPLLQVSPAWAYFVVTLVNAILLLALTGLFLAPRMTNSVQIAAVLAAFCSYALYDIFVMGQTALLTTTLLAAGFTLLEKRRAHSRWAYDILLALLLVLLAAKPSVGILLAALLLAEKAWRPLALGLVTLGVTWLALAPYYGGYVSGLCDYVWLLSHYCQAYATAYMAPALSPGVSTSFTSFLTVLFPEHGAAIFQADRWLFQLLLLGLVVVRWLGRISLPMLFQAVTWTFLLFSPFLLASEDIIICLLIVTGLFFRSGPGAPFKVLFVLLLVNLSMGVDFHLPLFFLVKLILALWWLIDAMKNRLQVTA
jgi:hypothetical protein